MLELTFHFFKELFHALFKIYFGEHKQLLDVKSFRSFAIDILKVVEGLLILLFIYFAGEQLIVIIKFAFFHKKYVFEFEEPIVIVYTIGTIFSFRFCRLGIRKMRDSIHVESFFVENFKVRIDRIHSKTILLNNKISKNYSTTFRFFSSWANEYNNYKDFINHLQSSTSVNSQELTCIADIAMKSTFGNFMCVIAYLDFFKQEKFEEMVNYFSKFERVTSVKKNTVERIFTIPGGKLKKESFYKSKLDKIGNFCLYCYMVLNRVCGCETYLLIHDESKRSFLANKFLIDVDYVLAFKNEEHSTENDLELYFAYPEAEGLNQTIKIEDSFFTEIFELDFRQRMVFFPADTTPTSFLKFEKQNLKYILEMLRISTIDHKTEINELLDEVKELLTINAFFNQVVIRQIDEWKIK